MTKKNASHMVINWVKQIGCSLPNTDEYSKIDEVAFDELETFFGSKKQNLVVSYSNHGAAAET